MRPIIAVCCIAVAVALGACSSCGRTGHPALVRQPDPPFKGELPEDKYVYDGPTGLYGGELVLAEPSEIETFNPLTAAGTSTTHILFVHVFRCLVDYRNPETKYDVGLCTKYEASPDFRQWTFHLRKGIKWSDGEPFTADDVVFTTNVILDPKVETPIRSILEEGRDASGNKIYPVAEKVDDYTVRFNLHSPNSGFLDAIYNLWLIPKHKLEASWRAGKFNDTMKITDNPDEIVSLGPFRIKERRPGQSVILERNPYFWKVDTKGQRLPYLNQMIFLIAPNFNTVFSKFQAAEIDALWRVRANEFKDVKKMEGPDVVVQETGLACDANYIAFNQNPGANPTTGKPYVVPWKLRLFRDQRFRQAVSYAIDRPGIGTAVFSGRAEPYYGFITPGDKAWYTGTEMKYEYDPPRARQLLAEIGLKDRNADGFLEDSEGNTVDFGILVNSNNSQRTDVASLVITNLKDVGLRARIEGVPFDQVLSRAEVRFDFDALLAGWQSGTPSGPINVKNILLSSGAQHYCFPQQSRPATDWEKRIDELVHQMDSAPDDAKRKDIYSEINRIWSEQLPEINLVAERFAIAYKSKFGNIRGSNLFAHVTWNCEEIYIK